MSLQEALESVKHEPAFKFKSSGQGGWYVELLGSGMIYRPQCPPANRELLEAISAFLYGDLALAIEMRQLYIDSFKECAP